MKEICNREKCYGCGACLNACLHNAISMKTDGCGALHPYIDNDRCTDCGLCRKVCPVNEPPVFRSPQACFAAWHNNSEERQECASGGVATSLARLFLENGGAAFGTRYDDNLSPVVARITLDSINLFKGSKYVQSSTGYVFKQIKDDLAAGLQVLFVGTPCQIAGLYGFLHKEYDNLTTCDLICHGVCPESYLKREVELLSRKHRLNDIKEIKFRSNNKQYDYCLSLWDSTGNAVYCKGERENPYFRGFLSNTTLRQSCYHCQFATGRRIADISLGDNTAFDKNDIDKSYGNVNVSVVLANTDKGSALIGQLAASGAMTFIERCISTETAGIPSMTAPISPTFSSRMFRAIYRLTSYIIASRLVVGSQIMYIKLHHAAHLLRKKLHI